MGVCGVKGCRRKARVAFDVRAFRGLPPGGVRAFAERHPLDGGHARVA